MWDWHHRDVQELFAAHRHIKNERLNTWKVHRMRAFVDAKVHGGLKKSVTTPEQFWPLPGDKITTKHLSTMRFMDREEIRRRYAAGGIEFTEAELDQMMAKIERAKEKEAEKKKNAGQDRIS